MAMLVISFQRFSYEVNMHAKQELSRDGLADPLYQQMNQTLTTTTLLSHQPKKK
jgi:hypothetical protein